MIMRGGYMSGSAPMATQPLPKLLWTIFLSIAFLLPINAPDREVGLSIGLLLFLLFSVPAAFSCLRLFLFELNAGGR